MFGWNESAWFLTFAGVAFKSTAVLAVAWLAAFLLRGQSAAIRHLVWTAAVVAILALPFFTVILPALPVRSAGALLPDAAFLFQTGTAIPTITPKIPHQNVSIGRTPQPAPWRGHWRLWLVLLWTAGILAALAQTLITCARLWRMRRSAKPFEDRPLALELTRRLRIRHPVDILETAEQTMPMAFGIARPVVLMPGVAAEWTEERRSVVLLHELAHVRRGDILTHMLARLALILNWWNPLAWMAWREFLKESERATDDLVLQAGARPADYAGHLLEVARTMQAPVASVGVAMARRSQLEGRLLAILDSRLNRRTAGRMPIVAATLLAIGIVAPLAALRAQDNSSAAIPPDIDATIRAALAQKNHEMLEKPAAALEALRQYDTAKKLLESAVAIREQVSGDQSTDYGVGLSKLGDLEKRRNRLDDAEAFYSKAARVLGDKPEAAPALTNLGVMMLHKKDPEQAVSYFQRAQRVNPEQSGPAWMWMGLVREREKNAAEAEAMYRSALAVEDPNSSDAATTTELYGRLLKSQGRDDEAQPLLDRAKTARKSLGAQPSARKAVDGVYRMGSSGITRPALISKVEPEYTEEARLAKYSGTVVLSVVVGPDGIAHDINVVQGLGFGLDNNAVAAIGAWRFQPATKDGAPVPVLANIEVNFKLM